MIEFDHVTRTYGPKPAVTDLSLSIPRGELFALLGPNGAGKTTTIKMLVGLLRPSRGAVRICGHDLAKEERSAHLHTGYVPDEPTLYDKLTGREFLWFIADMFGMPRHIATQKIDREIDHFELAEFADDLAESYSLGMKQRLVFAAALVIETLIYVHSMRGAWSAALCLARRSTFRCRHDAADRRAPASTHSAVGPPSLLGGGCGYVRPGRRAGPAV